MPRQTGDEFPVTKSPAPCRIEEPAGEKGWKALASLAIDVHAERYDLAARTATALASGREEARMEQAGRLYDRVEDDALRHILFVFR